ncbi:MAG TPA: outer membrane protein assembly factor BamD [Candidatus Manganitrophaceae bacterium]|nr:outer membrane protein assembly factor BamD [Candidatus Manganitrophaceae bacterium]
MNDRKKIIVVGFLCGALLAGCAGSGAKSDLLSLMGVDEKITESSDEGVENIYDAMTLLKRGEAYYVKEEYDAASEEYRRFLELHPFHRMAAFAQYRLGLSFYSQMDSRDRDPEPMEKAMAALRTLVDRYPQSLYVEEAREKIAELTRRRAEREFDIGLFYYKNEAYPAAISRFKKALEPEGKGALAEKTLYYLALSYDAAGRREEARATFEKLRTEHPGSPYARKSERKRTEWDGAFSGA